jgi:hypothetical protein
MSFKDVFQKPEQVESYSPCLEPVVQLLILHVPVFLTLCIHISESSGACDTAMWWLNEPSAVVLKCDGGDKFGASFGRTPKPRKKGLARK